MLEHRAPQNPIYLARGKERLAYLSLECAPHRQTNGIRSSYRGQRAIRRQRFLFQLGRRTSTVFLQLAGPYRFLLGRGDSLFLHERSPVAHGLASSRRCLVLVAGATIQDPPAPS
jgi:hypothetical protein